ncbi:zinc-dependent metalloprotease [Parapedobacter defluvii]|nr:zinc-dependent metalloprotease [Parapedobacter defluvii]
MKQKLRLGNSYVQIIHKFRYLKIQYFSLLAVSTIMCLEAHAQPERSEVPTTVGSPAHRSAVSSGNDSFTEIITANAKSQYGILGIHEVGGKIYLEIPDSLLGRDILTINRIANGWAGDKPFDPFLNFIGYSGDLANESLFRFARESDDAIVIYPLDYSSRVQADDGTLRLSANADVLPVLHSFPVLCRNRSDDGSLVDATEFLSGDNTIMTFSGSLRRKFKVGAMQPQHSVVSELEVTDGQLITSSIKTYSYNSETVRLGMHSVWFLLPVIPYEIRQPDHRVGYYTQSATDYSNPYTPQQSLRMVKRWRMEPRPEDREAYFRGEMVEPAKPLVIYIDPAMPEAWVPYMIQGINDWQPALEQAGFKNAIRGERVPPGMESRMMGDARYPMVCYKPSRVRNATAELVTDPRSGEILNAHIAWHHGAMANIIQWGAVMGAIHRPELRGDNTDTAFMGTMIRKIIAHEVGHVLGLVHNFGASSTVQVENLRNSGWLATNPISPSIMDYVRVNYVAQPEDSVSLPGLIPRIGPYDRWAIEWGYRIHPPHDGIKTSILLEEWTSKKLHDPNLWYGDEDRVDDPRCQAEDLGDDPVVAATYGMANLERLADSLSDWNRGKGHSHLRYTYLFDQYANYVKHAAVALNGDEERCRAALAFLNRYFFTYPPWFPASDPQRVLPSELEGAMTRLMREIIPLLLARTAGRPDGPFAFDMQDMLFASDSGPAAAAAFRRGMQVAYTETLTGMLSDKAAAEFPTLTHEARLRLSMAADDLLQWLSDELDVTTDLLQKTHLSALIHQLTNKLN